MQRRISIRRMLAAADALPHAALVVVTVVEVLDSRRQADEASATPTDRRTDDR